MNGTFHATSRQSFARSALFVERESHILILSKGAQVPEKTEIRNTFARDESNASDFGMETVRYACYRGKLSNPEWLDQDACEFSASFAFAISS